ncbi:MAG: ABC transporter ATP-binding protein [Planctomycetales bacterium]|nr:ABC transporter ATP-binding protein [Planctomycetales bacterium]
MISNTLKSLLGRAGRLTELNIATVVGALVAVCVPLLAYLLGAMLACLIDSQVVQQGAGSPQQLASWLPNLESLFPAGLSPLGQFSLLLVLGLGIVILAALLLHFFYRLVQSAAVEFEVALISQLREHAKRLATMRTVSAQQTALTDCLDYHLPRVRACLSRWWRTFPRYGIQGIACVAVAFAIQPMLALLTLIATVLVVLIYRLLDRLRRTALPVVRERAAQQREALVSLSIKGPLLESVHAETDVEKRFSEQLQLYRRDAVRSLTSSAWKAPTVIVAVGGLLSLFLFVIAVQILRSENSFSVPGAFTFSLCVAGAGLSASRLQRSWRELKTIETAAEELEQFLALQAEEFKGDHLKPISRVQRQAELEHVTVQDSSGRKLLENVSAVFKPGMLIGVLASQRLQAHALVELLMGFGRPVSGRMLVDDQLVSDLQPRSLAQCAHWIASDGALVTGTVQDNLLRPDMPTAHVDLSAAIAGAQLTEVLQQLPDGLATLITPGDDRLTGDAAFRLGIARAAATQASIMVIEEPSGHYDPQTEQQTLEAIRSLVQPQTISVVLPQRLSTLRNCDVVLMLHDHKVVDSGSHAELLQRNELYRHINYLRFNPFRSLAE